MICLKVKRKPYIYIKLQECFITSLEFATVKNQGKLSSEALFIVCHSSIISLPEIIKNFYF